MLMRQNRISRIPTDAHLNNINGKPHPFEALHKSFALSKSQFTGFGSVNATEPESAAGGDIHYEVSLNKFKLTKKLYGK